MNYQEAVAQIYGMRSVHEGVQPRLTQSSIHRRYGDKGMMGPGWQSRAAKDPNYAWYHHGLHLIGQRARSGGSHPAWRASRRAMLQHTAAAHQAAAAMHHKTADVMYKKGRPTAGDRFRQAAETHELIADTKF